MKKLSVIIPVYNAEKTLKRCMESVLKQKDEDLEIVLINDGSTDASDKIIQEYKGKNPKIISYYQKKNTGVADTRNYGIKKAKGSYILFLDADDYLDIHLYGLVKQYMEKDIELIKFKLQREDEKGNVIETVSGPVFENKTVDCILMLTPHCFRHSNNFARSVGAEFLGYIPSAIPVMNFRTGEVRFGEDALYKLVSPFYNKKNSIKGIR